MKVVAALAIMKNGKMLMGKRKDNGKWTNPGGHVEEGESPIDGAMREAKEEAGLELTHDRLYHLDTKIVETPGGKIRVHGYKVNLDEGTTTIKNDPDDEVHRWHWVSLKPPLNKDIFDNLHVPLEDNVLLGAMEIKMEKNAFFVGFEKAAISANAIKGMGRKLNRSFNGTRKANPEAFSGLRPKRLMASPEAFAGLRPKKLKARPLN